MLYEVITRQYDRGKVMSADDLDSGKNFGRYLDVDGDGIPYRTIPGTHPTKGAFFSRGTTRNAYAKYSEAGTDYVYNMERLRRKFVTARKLVPAPVTQKASQPTRYGAIYYGSVITSYSIHYTKLYDSSNAKASAIAGLVEP